MLHNRSNPLLSRTHKRILKSKFSLVYRSGAVLGTMANDTLSIADTHVQDVTFGLVTVEAGISFQMSKFEGILGLGFQSISKMGAKPPFYYLVEQKLIPQPLFSVYMGYEKDEGEGGEIVFGEIDHSKYQGNMTYVKLKSQDLWRIRVDLMSIGGKNGLFCAWGCDAAVDTGSSLVVRPSAEINEINKMIGATALTAQVQIARHLTLCHPLIS